MEKIKMLVALGLLLTTPALAEENVRPAMKGRSNPTDSRLCETSTMYTCNFGCGAGYETFACLDHLRDPRPTCVWPVSRTRICRHEDDKNVIKSFPPAAYPPVKRRR